MPVGNSLNSTKIFALIFLMTLAVMDGKEDESINDCPRGAAIGVGTNGAQEER